MKRAIVISAALALLVGVVFLAVNMGGGSTARGQEEPTPTPTLGPFTPTFSWTFDDAAPDDPNVVPVSDQCAIGAPCKSLWSMEIPDGQPTAPITGAFAPSPVLQGPGYELAPIGTITGRVFGSFRVGPAGRCATEGVVVGWSAMTFVATIDTNTTTNDLSSFSEWPTQLNGIRDAFLATHPEAVLSSRLVWGHNPPSNALYFTLPGGSISYTVVIGDPTTPPGQYCTPFVGNYISLGVSADNPETPQDEGGIPLRTCVEAGTNTMTVSLDRDDTPTGDPVILTDTAYCSPNTPAGENISVPLNGGTENLAGIDLTYSEVTSAGSTTIVTTTTGPPPPTGFKIVGLEELPLYFEINTDASYSGDLTVCVRYDETQVVGPEAGLRLMHHVDEGFVDITTSVDAANDIICGATTHLSTFVVAELAPTATPTPTATPVTPTPTRTPAPPTPTRTPGPHPPGVGGTVKLPPAALAAESGAATEGSGWATATWAALAGSAVAVAAAAWLARRRWLR